MFVSIFIISLILSIVESENVQPFEQLFGDTDFCLTKCETETHSLCDLRLRRSDPCDEDFFLYDISSQSRFFKDIMRGHNGIRNRIAGRMDVANMVKLKWHNDLSFMASKWVSQCIPYKQDPCATIFPTDISSEKKDAYKYVNSNSIYIKSNFLPPNLIVSALRTWYLEKNSMKPPKLLPHDEYRIKRNFFGTDIVGFFDVHNNFTQIANAETKYIGCALARYCKGFHLACYYYSYIKGDIFLSGRPVSQCPNVYPLPDAEFTNLCTADESLSIHFQLKNLIFVSILVHLIV